MTRNRVFLETQLLSRPRNSTPYGYRKFITAFTKTHIRTHLSQMMAGCLLGCSAVQSGRSLPTFQRYLLPQKTPILADVRTSNTTYLSQFNSLQPFSSYSSKIHCTISLLVPPSCLISSLFPTKILYVLQIVLVHATCPAYLTLCNLTSLIIMYN
jgi:hypothetical protein